METSPPGITVLCLPPEKSALIMGAESTRQFELYVKKTTKKTQFKNVEKGESTVWKMGLLMPSFIS